MYVYLPPLPPFSFVLKFSSVKSGCFNMLKLCHLQAAPSFPSSFPHLFSGKDNPRCLIPCAIDQVDSSLHLNTFVLVSSLFDPIIASYV